MKQKFKRLFIIFGVFLVFSLLFTIRTPVHAYTFETMPEGYRPITYADQGKVFGTDLELIIYFDTSFEASNFSDLSILYFSSSSTPRIVANSNYVQIFLPGNEKDSIASGSTWYYDFFTFENGDFIRFDSENTSSTFTSFLYVKDISSVCYTEEDLENARLEGYNEGFNVGVSSVDTQDYYNQGYSAASDDFLVFENLIFGTMNGFTRTIQSLMDFEIFGFSVFGLVGGLVGVAFGIGLIVLIIKVVKIFV